MYMVSVKSKLQASAPPPPPPPPGLPQAYDTFGAGNMIIGQPFKVGVT